MEEIDPLDLEIEDTANDFIVRVSSTSQIQELMKIGHNTKVSQTFMPDIQFDTNLNIAFMDCPGFMDNRGPEINISNAANIRNSINSSKTVKVVILINFHTLRADRAKGLRDLVSICIDLFGNSEQLKQNKNSILIGISQCS